MDINFILIFFTLIKLIMRYQKLHFVTQWNGSFKIPKTWIKTKDVPTSIGFSKRISKMLSADL